MEYQERNMLLWYASNLSMMFFSVILLLISYNAVAITITLSHISKQCHADVTHSSAYNDITVKSSCSITP